MTLLACSNKSQESVRGLIPRVFTSMEFWRRIGLVFLFLMASLACTPNEYQTPTLKQTPDENVTNSESVPLAPSVSQVVIQQETVIEVVPQREVPPTIPSSELLARGESVYRENCAHCHGPRGDGKGELAASLNPPPSDFTAGVFKFRNTPTGQLPTEDDLFRTISNGVSGTSMSDYRDLSEKDRRAIVVYLKSLSPRFIEEPEGETIVPPPTRSTAPEVIERGRQVYNQMLCAACHGEGARGDGPLAESLTDSDGRPIQPADLTTPQLKSGQGAESIYRTVMTGLDGTPMPSYGDSLDPEEAWDLALYIVALSESGDTQ